MTALPGSRTPGMRRTEQMGNTSCGVMEDVQREYRDCINRFLVGSWAWLQGKPERMLQREGEAWPEHLRPAVVKILGSTVHSTGGQASQRLLHFIRTLSYGIQENLGPLLSHRLLFGEAKEKAEVFRCYARARKLLGRRLPIVGELDKAVFEAIVKRLGECEAGDLEGLKLMPRGFF